MEVTPQQLMEIFKAGFRVGENYRMKNLNPAIVASNEEIEADGYFIIFNVLGAYLAFARRCGRVEQAKKLFYEMQSVPKMTPLPIMLERFRQQDAERNPELYKDMKGIL